jgi:nucleotide-binding universal stress UspA family protein
MAPPSRGLQENGAVSRLTRLYLNSLEQSLDAFRERAPGTKVETLLVEGDPVSEILAAAEGADCDLIVMGAHSTSGLRTLFLGNVAAGVMNRANCPVVTVRIPVAMAEAETDNPKTSGAVAQTCEAHVVS